MRTHRIRDAAYAVIAGGVGFVPAPPGCLEAAEEMLEGLTLLGKKRAAGEIREDAWGYERDHRGQFDRGLSQWRDDERKDVFHYDARTRAVLKENGIPLREWTLFFGAQARSWRLLYKLGIECMEEFDRLLPNHGILDSFKAFGHQHPNRGLVYERRLDNNVETACPHVDRSFISMHHYETGPGFFIVPTDSEERLHVHIPRNYVAVFPGLKFHKMTGGKVRALKHGTHEVPSLEPSGRRASVFFLHTNVSHL